MRRRRRPLSLVRPELPVGCVGLLRAISPRTVNDDGNNNTHTRAPFVPFIYIAPLRRDGHRVRSDLCVRFGGAFARPPPPPNCCSAATSRPAKDSQKAGARAGEGGCVSTRVRSRAFAVRQRSQETASLWEIHKAKKEKYPPHTYATCAGNKY